MFRNATAIEAFEARGTTIPAAEDAARAKAEEIWRRLKVDRPGIKPKRP
jgi:hypothetical protein